MDLAVLDAEAAAPRPDVAPRPQRPAGAARPAAAAAHTPVLLERCLDLLAGALEGPGAPERPVMIDCTLGAGGHAEGALRRFPALSVVGIDRDPEAIALAGERLAPFGRRFRAVRTTYDRVDAVAREASVRPDGRVPSGMDSTLPAHLNDVQVGGWERLRRARGGPDRDQSSPARPRRASISSRGTPLVSGMTLSTHSS